jgi:hypothetical protein
MAAAYLSMKARRQTGYTGADFRDVTRTER